MSIQVCRNMSKMPFFRFLARDIIYARPIARYMLSPVRPSVRLSVTHVDQSKMVKLGSRNLHHRVAP